MSRCILKPLIGFNFFFLTISFLLFPLKLFASDELNQQGVDAYQQEQYGIAREKFLLACNAGTFISCSSLADMLYRGLGGEKDLPQARKISERACNANVHFGCALLGHMTRFGQGGAQDQPAAFNLYVKACHGGNANACDRAAYMAYVGEGIATNKSQAWGLHKFACLGGDANGCESLAQYFHTGNGAKKDEEKARIYFDQGCQYGSGRSCFNFAAYNEMGTGGVTDEILAKNAFKKSCDLNFTDGCAQYARFLQHGKGGKQDLPAAEAMYKSLCESDERNHCLGLAEVLDDDRQVGPPADLQVQSLFEQLCDEGLTRACSRGLVSRMYRLPDNGSTLSKVREFHFDISLFSSIIGIDEKDWNDKSDYVSLLQTADQLFNDIVSSNSFKTVEKVVPTDMSKPQHSFICSVSTRNSRAALLQLQYDKRDALKLLDGLMDLHRGVISDQQAELNDQRSVLDRKAEALEKLIQSRGWNVVANIDLVESELTLRNLADKYANLNAMKEDLRDREKSIRNAIAKIDTQIELITKQADKPCVLAEYHWLNDVNQKIIITSLEQDHRSTIASIEIPELDFTLSKLFRQFRDPETLEITQSISGVKSLLTYSNYGK